MTCPECGHPVVGRRRRLARVFPWVGRVCGAELGEDATGWGPEACTCTHPIHAEHTR